MLGNLILSDFTEEASDPALFVSGKLFTFDRSPEDNRITKIV